MFKRLTHERSQAESNRAQRLENLSGAFAVVSHQDRILILDDVLTTGATLEAATQALLADHPGTLVYQGAVFYTPETFEV